MRATAGGRALLLLLPSERAGMLAALEAARVPIRQIRLNPGKAQPVTPALQALLSKNTELKVRVAGDSRHTVPPLASAVPVKCCDDLLISRCTMQPQACAVRSSRVA